MNRSFIALLVLALLGTTLPSPAFAQAQAVETKAFLASPGEPIKTIGLLTIDEPWGYFLGEGGVSSFGITGILVSTFKRPKHPEYQKAGFRFSDRAERVLTEHLKAAGFNVVPVPVKRKKSFQLLRNYKTLSAPNVDAYLDVVSGGVGYRQNDSAPDFAQKVGPYVMITVQLISARSKEILYADTIEYSWRKAHRKGLPGSEVNAPDEQVFADAESVKMDLLGGQGSRSLAQLTQGIDIAMRKIVSEFSAYPETGNAKRGPDAAPSTTVAKAAPATGPDEYRESLKNIVGKWVGSGMSEHGTPYDVQFSISENGSMRIEWQTLRNSGKATYPPGALRFNGDRFEYNSKIERLLCTLTLYKDEKGRDTLKGQRSDGNHWQIKRKR